MANLQSLVDTDLLNYYRGKEEEKNAKTFVKGTELDEKVGDLGFKTEEELKTTFVEKDGSKVLSDNNYTTEDKNKVGTALQPGALDDYVDNSALTNAIKDFITSGNVDTKVAQAIAELGDVVKIADEPIITSSQKATLKSTAKEGEFYIISDDNNHISLFLGVGKGSADENGFYDMQTHVDLNGLLSESDAADTYLAIEDAEKDFAKKTEIPQIKVAETSVIDGWFA